MAKPMSYSDRVCRALVIDFGSADLPIMALKRIGVPVDLIGMDRVDDFEGDIEALGETFRGRLGDGVALVFAFDEGSAAPASNCDWDDALHRPLTRCFTFVRAFGPVLQARRGICVALLPINAVLPDRAQGAASILGRALLGLFEALRAESDELQTSILFLDPDQKAEDLAERFQGLVSRRGMYSIPTNVHEADLIAAYRTMLQSAEQTPRAPNFPLPPTPMGIVYSREIASLAKDGSHMAV